MAKRDRMSGNEAVATAMKQINPDVMGAFPITPSTEIPQYFSQYIADGEVDTEFVAVESEHSAMSVCIGASAAGAQAQLISAASQFYNARTAVAELVNKAAQFNVSTGLDVASKNQAADLAMIEDRLKALLADCQLFAQMATSLFNNVHASAGTSYAVSGT